MRTCLITGGAGNLACQLSHALANVFDRLVLADVAEKPVGPVPRTAVFERADLADETQVREQLHRHRPRVVVHLASLLSGSCEQDRVRGWQVNANGTFHLLESALREGVETVLFASSVAAFGGELPDPLPENAPQWPDGLYGVTKMASERLGVYYHRRHGLDFRCLRLPITISRFAPAGAASAFASHAFVESMRGARYCFRVRPDTRLALIYVGDVVHAMQVFLASSAQSLTQRVYNLHAMTVTPREIAEAILQRLPSTDLCFDPDPAIADLVASWPSAMDDSRARRDWGWQEQFNLDRTADHLLQELQREVESA